MMVKTCSKCGVSKDTTEFGPRKRSKDGLKGFCRECCNIANSVARAKDPVRAKSNVRRWHLRVRYGITEEKLISLTEAQGFICAICADTLDLPSGKFAVDHNHDTGDVRGVLCPTCNQGIGLLKDNPTVLRSAAMYLETRGHYG